MRNCIRRNSAFTQLAYTNENPPESYIYDKILRPLQHSKDLQRYNILCCNVSQKCSACAEDAVALLLLAIAS